MSNPYLTIQSPPFDPSDYGLTVFQPDMVLTAGQLNQLFGFLLGQEQQTRTRLLGVGVACGLVPGRAADGASISVTPGCGVTTEGDLLCPKVDAPFVRYAVFDQANHPDYPPFQVIGGLQLWEIFPALPAGAEAPTGAPVTTPLAGFELSDKVVLLYLESAVQAADECTGVACDNKGDAYNNRLHVLLCRQTDAAALIRAEHREAAAAYTRLPILPMARVQLDAQDYPDSLLAFQAFISRAASDFAKGLTHARSLIQDVAGIGPVKDWAHLLVKKAHDASRDDYIQYAYDWLKDLHEAYEEFRQATALWLVACLPPETAFPKHLLLGELVPAPGLCQPQYRHAWLRSPAVDAAPNARDQAVWLFQRLGHLIEEFVVPASPGKTVVASAEALRLTPDVARTAAFDRRSLPFYYRPDLRAFWSYDKAHSCRTGHLLSYHEAVAGAPPQVVTPFRFQVEPFSFYRIEGLLNAPVTNVLTRLLTLRQQYNLAFDVVALRVDDRQNLLFSQTQEFDFADLQIDFDELMAEIRCEEAEIQAPDKEFKPLQVALPMLTTLFTARLTPYEFLLQRLIGQLPAAQCIKDKLPLLLRLNQAYQQRKKDLEDALTFGPFLRANPGLEHGAGVPRGGTFVLVYRGDELKRLREISPRLRNRSGFPITRRGGAPLVVADFYLPYRLGGRGPAVQFVLPQPPASISMEAARFCLNDPASPLTVAPAGGSFGEDALVSREGNRFFFNPTAVGRHPLTYTAPDGQTASLDVEVLALPTVSFNPDAGPNGLVSFGLQATDATEVTWDFGDGTAPERIVLDANTTGATRHQYQLQADGSGKFEVHLTASNGVCGTAAEPKVVEFKPRPTPEIKQLGPVCFNSDNKLTAKPAGGTFKSETLEVNAKGQFNANRPGKHVISYEVGGGQTTTEVFVLPGDFTLENVKSIGQNAFRVEAVVLTPPEGVAYEWQFSKPVDPKDQKVEGDNTRFVFELTFQQPPLTHAVPLPTLDLIIRKKADGSACPTISKSLRGNQ
ncbi:PKD domain-containing protein [Hymenobacter terricola]|uniref:PKD domain-containing protein n=1 Tax=Hymenobacter terricola TaxID=2819236 RepID=UPI001B307A2D|nr:PKD domain-containing protein [Hymenobacter terricola]